MVWNKTCKHCKNGEGAIIRESSKVKAVLAGKKHLWIRCEHYFETYGNKFGITKDDYTCPAFRADLWTLWKKKLSSTSEVESEQGETNSNNSEMFPTNSTNPEDGDSLEFEVNSQQQIRLESQKAFTNYRDNVSQASMTGFENSQSQAYPDGFSEASCSEHSMFSQPHSVSSASNARQLHNSATPNSSQLSSFSEMSNLSATSSQSLGLSVGPQAIYSQASQVSRKPLARINTNPKKMKLATVRTLKYTHKNCMICRQGPPDGTKCIPEHARRDLWLTEDIYLPQGSRACKSHISEEIFNADAKVTIRNLAVEGVNVTTKETEQWIKWLTEKLKLNKKILNFSEKVDPGTYEEILGVSERDFDNIFSHIEGHLVESRNRTPRNALGVFLAKLRLGVSQSVLGRLFGIPRQSVVSDTIHRVTDLLTEHFVPFYLGVNHIGRDKVKNDHNPQYVRQLFKIEEPASLVFVADGTYVYIQKSSDFEVQSRTFSPHKHRHLLKFMMVTTPDGYIIDAIGPYYADSKNNDASILSHMLDDDPRLPDNFAVQGDLLLLDRGFRNVTPELDKLGIKWVMPAFLPKDRKAFTVEEANETRRVCLCRWSVEATNGRIKNKFDFFDNIVPNTYIPILAKVYRIACAIVNATFTPNFTEGPRHQYILDQVELRLHLCNEMKERVEQCNLERRVFWKKATAVECTDFPRLTKEDIMKITLGVYQVRMGSLYNIRHLLKDDLYEMWFHKEESGIIRVRLQSRFRRAMTHTLWIKYKNDSDEPSENILGYYCLCQQGSRTLGTCAHITAVLLYLGLERYQPKQRKMQLEILDAVDRRVREENGENMDMQDSQEN